MNKLITVLISLFITLTLPLQGADILKEFTRNPSENNLIVHDFFPLLSQENIPLKLPAPLKISLIPIVYSRIEQHMAIVEDFLKQSNPIHLDENFRMLIWNLAKAKVILHRLEIKDPQLVKKIEQLLEKSRKLYHQKKMKSYVTLAMTSAYELEENSFWIELLSLASSPNLRADFASQYENETFSPPWPKDKERCGTTARALLFLFHRLNRIPGLLTDGYYTHQKGIPHLKHEILKNHKSQKKRAIYWVDSAKLDHMFLIQQTSHRHYRILQSFVNKYSLEESLAQGKNLTLDQILSFLDSIHRLEKTHEWTEEVAQTYENLFLSKPSSLFIDDFIRSKSQVNFVVKFYSLSV